MKYILQASLDGRLKSDFGEESTVVDLCTLTAAASKDLYLTAAQVTFYLNVSGGIDTTSRVALVINGIEKEPARVSLNSNHLVSSSRSGGNTSVVYEFKNLGYKVTASQIMKLEITAIDTDTDISGFIQAIEVPSGENPTTYTGA